MSIEFVLTFILLAFAVVGVGELYLFVIREGQFLDFMARPLAWLHARSAQSKAAEFAFKSIGGCRICTIQRFADLACVLLWFLFPEPWYFDLLTYILFGGMVFYAQSRGQEKSVEWRQPDLNGQPNFTSKNLDL